MGYDDDFEESPVKAASSKVSAAAQPSKTSTAPPADHSASIAAITASLDARFEAEEKRAKAEREAHERRVSEWNTQREEQARRDAADLATRREADRKAATEMLSRQEEAAKKLQEQQERLTEQMAAFMAQQQQQQQQQQQLILHQQQQEVQRHRDPLDMSDDEGGGRRKRRERERERDFRRLQEEEAAHSLFHRLAKDVREVFNELNMSVVAAEKERLLKDDRYRKEREARDRREEAERLERDQRQERERAEREEAFWKALGERESRYTEAVEKRALKDDADREERLQRDIEERTQRTRTDREVRDGLERLDRERRDREDALSLERDRKLIQSQVDDMKRQFQEHCEEIRRQFAVERGHLAEVHKMEMAAAEKRSIEALGANDKYHKDYALGAEQQAASAAKLEALVTLCNEAVTGTRAMLEEEGERRMAVIKQREASSEESAELVRRVLTDMTEMKEALNMERQRVAALYSKFDLTISNFNRTNEEWQRKFDEGRAHYDTLRQQLEKDKKAMLHEVAQERKLLDRQHEDFLAEKMRTMSEIQSERMAIMKDRTEAALAREKHNKDETALLLSLRTKEEEYQCRLEAIAADRDLANDLRREAQRLRDEAALERENLRRERVGFEQERDGIMMRVEYVRQKADDAIVDQNRLRKELAHERASNMQLGRSNSVPMITAPAASSQFHLELAKQRAALSRLSENMQ